MLIHVKVSRFSLQLLLCIHTCIRCVGKCDSDIVHLVRKYLSLVVEEEDDEIETKAYEMTAALSILNILLENGYDKSELSSKHANLYLIDFIFIYLYFRLY